MAHLGATLKGGKTRLPNCARTFFDNVKGTIFV